MSVASSLILKFHFFKSIDFYEFFELFHRHKDAANILEYRWPPHEKGVDWYLIQEHVSEYLGVVSFKRKYPGANLLFIFFTIYYNTT